MSSQTEYDQVYAKRLAAIERDHQLTILSSMNQPQSDASKKATQYIVYTDYKPDSPAKSFTISVYTPFENVDKYGHSKAEFQSQLLFDTDRWQDKMHITVLETLGSESRLAFFDFQNMGLAQLALKAFMNLARKAEVGKIDGNISSFDKENYAKLKHIFEKYEFDFQMTDPKLGIGKISKSFKA